MHPDTDSWAGDSDIRQQPKTSQAAAGPFPLLPGRERPELSPHTIFGFPLPLEILGLGQLPGKSQQARPGSFLWILSFLTWMVLGTLP